MDIPIYGARIIFGHGSDLPAVNTFLVYRGDFWEGDGSAPRSILGLYFHDLMKAFHAEGNKIMGEGNMYGQYSVASVEFGNRTWTDDKDVKKMSLEDFIKAGMPDIYPGK